MAVLAGRWRRARYSREYQMVFSGTWPYPPEPRGHRRSDPGLDT